MAPARQFTTCQTADDALGVARRATCRGMQRPVPGALPQVRDCAPPRSLFQKMRLLFYGRSAAEEELLQQAPPGLIPSGRVSSACPQSASWKREWFSFFLFPLVRAPALAHPPSAADQSRRRCPASAAARGGTPGPQPEGRPAATRGRARRPDGGPGAASGDGRRRPYLHAQPLLQHQGGAQVAGAADEELVGAALEEGQRGADLAQLPELVQPPLEVGQPQGAVDQRCHRAHPRAAQQEGGAGVGVGLAAALLEAQAGVHDAAGRPQVGLPRRREQRALRDVVEHVGHAGHAAVQPALAAAGAAQGRQLPQDPLDGGRHQRHRRLPVRRRRRAARVVIEAVGEAALALHAPAGAARRGALRSGELPGEGAGERGGGSAEEAAGSGRGGKEAPPLRGGGPGVRCRAAESGRGGETVRPPRQCRERVCAGRSPPPPARGGAAAAAHLSAHRRGDRKLPPPAPGERSPSGHGTCRRGGRD